MDREPHIKARPKMTELTPRQYQFCAEYLIDFNGSKAAIRAGYSPKTAKEQAYDLLTRPHIQAEIDRRKAKLAQKTEITAERIVRELAKIAFANMKDFTRWSEGGVVLIDSNSLTSDQTAAVA